MRYVINIEEMSLPVNVTVKNGSALRLLCWTENDAKESVVVCPFGAVSSPFCLNYALQVPATVYGKPNNWAILNCTTDGFLLTTISVHSVRRKRRTTRGGYDGIPREGWFSPYKMDM